MHMPPSGFTRRLGRNGAEIFPIGIGSMSFTPFYGPVERENGLAILKEAMDLGVNHIDTANIYGMGLAEDIIGEFIRDVGAAARDFFVIASKVGINRGNKEKPFRNDPQHIKAELDDTLKRLGVETIDLYYIHRREADIPIEDVAGTLKDLIATGKIKSFGFSEIAPSSLRRAQTVHPVAAVQSEYSLSTRQVELGMLQATAETGTSFVGFCPLGRSLLTDKPHSRAHAETLPFLENNPRFMEPNLSANHAAAAGFRAIAAEMGIRASTLAIAWMLTRGDNIIPVPGTRSVEHFRELIAAVDVHLDADMLAAIDTALPAGWAHGDRYSAEQWNGIERYF